MYKIIDIAKPAMLFIYCETKYLKINIKIQL